MRTLLAIVTLLAACRGGRSKHHDAGHAPASVVSVVPKLPKSPDGTAELVRLDAEIAIDKAQPAVALPLVLAVAGIRGRLEDYQAALAGTASYLAAHPDDPGAIRLRVQALSAVHQFADARALLAKLPADDPLGVALDEATGNMTKSLAAREQSARLGPSTTNLVLYAATLALAGNTDAALAKMPEAVKAIGDNAPELYSWLLFQWGRIYELKGDLATAKDFFAAAHHRMPGYLEATAHLAQAMAKTGDAAEADKLVMAALAENRHPQLLGIAVELGHKELLDEAKREWERYVAALPLAFSDHAARFYLTIDPARALVLSRVNLANRDTTEARALVAEAALAAGDAQAACDVIAPLVTGQAPKSQRFIAWRALAKCGRKEEADRLGHDLGIAQ